MDVDNLRKSVRDMLDAIKFDEITSKIVLQNKDDKYLLAILWKAFMATCGEQIEEADDPSLYCRLITVTNDYLQEVSTSGDTRELFNSWLSEIQDEWNT